MNFARGQTVGNDGTPFPLDIFAETLSINLVGTFNVARLVAAQIISQYPLPKNATAAEQVAEDRGVLIFTSSVSATEGQMGQAAYASSKAGVEGLVLPMARDLARYGEHSLDRGGLSVRRAGLRRGEFSL